MVLVANRISSNSDENCQLASSRPHKQDSNNDDKCSNLHQSGTHEASDILITPKLLENDNGSGIREESIQVGGTAAPLSAIHQAVILAKCLLIEKSARHDDMQSKLNICVNIAISFSPWDKLSGGVSWLQELPISFDL